MTDAEKLRELARQYVQNIGLRTPELVAWRDDLNRIADLLDAVPPEALKALADGTHIVIPKDGGVVIITKVEGSGGGIDDVSQAPEKPENP